MIWCWGGEASAALASFGVGEYSPACPSWGDISGSRVGAQNFHAWMINLPAYGAGVTILRTDDQVADRDLRDPQWDPVGTAVADHDSTKGFDVPGSGPGAGSVISYFGGHGYCGTGNRHGKPSPEVTCTSSAQCDGTGAPAETTTTFWGGSCMVSPQWPGSPGVGSCAYPYPHRMVTCSTRDLNQNLSATAGVDYSWGLAKEFRAGENSFAGGWGGAGTNGGSKAVFAHISCGAHWGTALFDVYHAFGGIQMFGTVWIVGGDTSTTSQTGSNFGYLAWAAGGNYDVADMWADIVPTIAAGTGCMPGFAAGGINGCGGNMTTAIDTTQAKANAHFDHDYYEIWGNGLNPTGVGYWAVTASCNYDCVTTPPVL